MARRVVVTGLGTLNALGNDVQTSWEAVVAARSGVRLITRFEPARLDMPCLIAAELKDFQPEKWFQRRDLKKLDLMTQYGIAAASQAWEQAGLNGVDTYDPERAGGRTPPLLCAGRHSLPEGGGVASGQLCGDDPQRRASG